MLQIFCKLQQYQRTVLVFAQILNEDFTVKVVKAYQALIELKSMVKTLCCLCWGLKNSGFWMALRLKMTFLLEPIGGLFECTVVNFFLEAEKDLLWSRECLKTVIFKYRDFFVCFWKAVERWIYGFISYFWCTYVKSWVFIGS